MPTRGCEKSILKDQRRPRHRILLTLHHGDKRVALLQQRNGSTDQNFTFVERNEVPTATPYHHQPHVGVIQRLSGYRCELHHVVLWLCQP